MFLRRSSSALTARSIVVAGSLAQRAGYGGHAWVFLQYLLGFRRLGFDVLFLDRLQPEMCTDATGAPAPAEDSMQLAFLDATMRAHDIPYAVLLDDGRAVMRARRDELVGRLRSCALLLDVMGYLGDDELREAASLSVYLDIDPGFGQMWCATGLADLYGRHHAYATVGTNVGAPGCLIPSCDIDWIPTRPPVVLDEWPEQAGPGSAITTVASWRGPFAPVELEGRTYGLRVHEFRRFFELPEHSDANFELALDIDQRETNDLAVLRAHGWKLVDPRQVAGDINSYRSFVQGSAAELLVAKNMYVDTCSGWLSDRSVCYLASGRPVIAQDTGVREELRTGEGLLWFRDLDEAVDAIERARREPERHAAAARRLAEREFSSDYVLDALLHALGIS